MKLSNFHTHTIWCDGKNTPRQIVQKAIKDGFDALGFSGHGYTPFDTSYCMSLENVPCYKQEIKALKKEFSEQIKIYLGCEEDLFAQVADEDYDYIISSLHYVESEGQYFPIDESENTFCEIAEKCFKGDYIAFAEAYYRTLESKLLQSKGKIAGHFDLITKYNEGERLFSEEDPRYRRAALNALNSAEGKVIEVNTGAMARGLKSTPYPAPFLLQEIQRRGWKVILSSDCHDANFLQYGFSDVLLLLKKIGFTDEQIVGTPWAE